MSALKTEAQPPAGNPATAAAPAGSTTILARSTRARSARDNDSSETVRISSQ